MSACVIIAQNDKIYIGADSACSLKTEHGFKRCHNNMQKLFRFGNQILFCSGKTSEVYDCITWMESNMPNNIDINGLSKHLKRCFKDVFCEECFNVELFIVDYDTKYIYQISQYNDFEVLKYKSSDQLFVLCGGYKTSGFFNKIKDNILLNKSIIDAYINTYADMCDECVGGYVTIYASPNDSIKYKIDNLDIRHIQENKSFLLTAEFVTAGHISGSQIIGGEIYSSNFEEFENGQTKGSYINLLDGTFSFGGGSITFNNDKLTISSPSIKETVDNAINDLDVEGKIENAVSGLPTQSDVESTVNEAIKDLPTESRVTEITSTAISTANIDASRITTGTLNAERIKGVTLNSNRIESGTIIGGSLFIGDTNRLGSYAEIDDNGKLTCNDVCIMGGELNIINKDNGTGVSISKLGIATFNGVTISNGQLIMQSQDGTTQASIINGTLTCNNAFISGTINASTIKSSKIEGGDVDVYGSLNVYQDTKCLGNIGAVYGYSISGGVGSVTYGVGLASYMNSNQCMVTDSGAALSAFGGTSKISAYQNGISLDAAGVLLNGSAIGSSDENVKHDINYDLEKYENMYNDLMPCSYKFNFGTSNRDHTGFIAQKVKDAIINNGLSTSQFAAYVEIDNADSFGYGEYGLRYDEFVALNTWQIQKLKKRVSELEEKIKNISNK